jgi:N-sulfoglucosamine sulfohydrolase
MKTVDRAAMKAQILLFYYVLQFANAAPAPQKNVLLMFIDDGGFEMGVYGNKAVNTPNIDDFAKRAITFKHGFTSVSSCSPSRSALLTGISFSILIMSWILTFRVLHTCTCT